MTRRGHEARDDRTTTRPRRRDLPRRAETSTKLGRERGPSDRRPKPNEHHQQRRCPFPRSPRSSTEAGGSGPERRPIRPPRRPGSRHEARSRARGTTPESGGSRRPGAGKPGRRPRPPTPSSRRSARWPGWARMGPNRTGEPSPALWNLTTGIDLGSTLRPRPCSRRPSPSPKVGAWRGTRSPGRSPSRGAGAIRRLDALVSLSRGRRTYRGGRLVDPSILRSLPS